MTARRAKHHRSEPAIRSFLGHPVRRNTLTVMMRSQRRRALARPAPVCSGSPGTRLFELPRCIKRRYAPIVPQSIEFHGPLHDPLLPRNVQL